MEAARSSVSLVSYLNTIQCHKPEDMDLEQSCTTHLKVVRDKTVLSFLKEDYILKSSRKNIII